MSGPPSFSIGIEEEYMLVDEDDRNLIREAPPTLMAELAEILGPQVSPEFLQCQVEVGTPVCEDLSQARAHLAYLRRSVANVVAGHGLRLMAASTSWSISIRLGRKPVTP